MKKIFALMALVGAITITTYGQENIELYDRISENLDIIQIYDTSDLSYEILSDRSENGIIIIEKIIGIVLNSDGDGKILNTTDEQFDYISYKYVNGVQEGDIILTYCIYNPDTDYTDDIINRFDYIIDTAE